MKFVTDSGSIYEIISRIGCIFLIRRSNSKLEEIKTNNADVEMYRIEFIPKIIVGKSTRFNIIKNNRIYEVETSKVNSIEL